MKTHRFAALFLTLSMLLCTLPVSAAEGDDWLVPRMRDSTAFTDTAGTICETAADICWMVCPLKIIQSRSWQKSEAKKSVSFFRILISSAI